MIKNIIFDFGNVLLKWDEDEIVSHYSDDIEEKNILKKVIFKSKDWLRLDEGKLTYEEAKKIFTENLPDNLKEKVDYIMATWYKHLIVNEAICDVIKKLKQNGYKIFAFSNTHIVVYEYVKKLDVGKNFDGYLISAIEQKTRELHNQKKSPSLFGRIFLRRSANESDSGKWK